MARGSVVAAVLRAPAAPCARPRRVLGRGCVVGLGVFFPEALAPVKARASGRSFVVAAVTVLAFLRSRNRVSALPRPPPWVRGGRDKARSNRVRDGKTGRNQLREERHGLDGVNRPGPGAGSVSARWRSRNGFRLRPATDSGWNQPGWLKFGERRGGQFSMSVFAHSRGVTGKEGVDEFVDGLLFRAGQGFDALEPARQDSALGTVGLLGLRIVQDVTGGDRERPGQSGHLIDGQASGAALDVRDIGVPRTEQLSELTLRHFTGLANGAKSRADFSF